MNLDQIVSALRNILSLIIGWAVGKGYLENDTGAMIIGVVAALAPIAWGIYANTRAAQVASVAAMPNVEKVIMSDQKSADAIPSDKVKSLWADRNQV